MEYLLSAAFRAVCSIFSPKALGILLFSMGINALVLLGLIVGLSSLLSSTTFFSDGLLEMAADWVGRAMSIGIALMLFPLFLPLILSLFDEKIASMIEKRDYPHLPDAEPPFWPTIAQDAKFVLKAITLNIVCIPLYFIPLVNLFVYYVLNGYLLGTEFFNVAAGRFISRAEGNQLRRKYNMHIIGGGALIAFCATLPVVNLITPLWGVAVMIHFFHLVQPESDIQILPPKT